MCGPDVDRESEEFRADWAGQIRVTIAPPPIAKIDRDGIVAGQRLDVRSGIFALGDAEIGLAAGVGGVAGMATLIDQQKSDGASERRRI